MYSFLCFVAILQWILFIYLPIAAFYGIIRLLMRADTAYIICSPILGIRKISLRTGFIVWLIQALLFGMELYEIGQWIRVGVNPLIQIW